MARLPNRTHNPPRSGLPSLGTHRAPIVGRGLHGTPFRNIRKFHQSKAFKMQQRAVHRIKATSMKGVTGIRKQRPR